MRTLAPSTHADRNGRLRNISFALAGVSALTAGLLSMSPAVAGPATTPINPLAAYSDWNVVSFGDVTMNAESEGPVAVGGNLSFSGTNVAFKTSTAVALLVGGKVDLSQSTGTLQVLSQGAIRIGDLTGTTVLDTDQNNAAVNTQVVEAGSPYGSNPAVVSNHRQAASTVSAPGQFAGTFAQSDAIAAAALVSAAATGTCNAEHVLTTPIVNGRVSLAMAPGANYWNLTTAELSSLDEVTFGGPVTPSPQNPLIINVSGNGPADLSLTLAGARDPRGILYNFPDASSITQGGDSIDGSLLAPRAAYTKTSANLQGTAIVGDAILGGSEEHYFPFGGFIETCATITPAPVPTATTAAPVPTATTAAPVPTATTAAPVPTATATTAAPVPTAPATTAAPVPTATVAAPVPVPTATATTAAPVPTATSSQAASPAVAPEAALAYTGVNSQPLVWIAAALLALGLIFTAITRRRNSKRNAEPTV
ncbi:choice-of-anchor A family protein [Arthrobacter sp. ISL-48]|uniref:choice-of-anchor A family protein n=1 Tax=Arthrobacter sp. ISL-48 TaxID=2819110 RepID=UPI001BE98FCE|nr:choice-of-anchor A family protein [Arthrobacter sp. ISL-48]MBT2530728.1 choice-of-anchor A family protein [Arthrobacter sp. ISL-48]